MRTTSTRSAATTTLLLAPPGAGRTDYLLQTLRGIRKQPDWQETWLLTPNRTQQQFLRQRLLAPARESAAIFNVRFLEFHDLATTLSVLAGRPTRVLQEEERRDLLRNLLEDMALDGVLKVFSQVADSGGMLRAILSFIDELRASQISTVAFAAAARGIRERELAAIARRYEAALSEGNAQDRTGSLVHAAEALGDPIVQNHLARIDHLLVDGFDGFTPLQARVVVRLAASVRKAIITLPTAPGREETVGAGFRRALVLLGEHSPRPIRIETLTASLDRRGAGLQELTTRLFADGPASTQQHAHLHLLEAPGPENEALAITRRIKGLLLDSDARCEDCLIVLRDWQLYAGPLRAAGSEHGVPLAFARGEPLIDQPVMRHLLGLLELSGADFPLQKTLDVLRAPCFRVPGLGREQVARLERIGREQRAHGGREIWLSALYESRVEGSENIAQALCRFMEAVTPPGDQESTELWRWLRGLCGLDPEAKPDLYSLDMRCLVAAGPSNVSLAGEQAALDAFDSLLKRRARTSEELSGPESAGQADADAWLADLREALERARLESDRARPGAVTVVEASMATGLAARHVFIPGLSAGISPRKSGVDPLLLASEREALAERGADLGLGDGGGEDALFLQLLGLARDSLMLSRPAEEQGTARQASHLWAAVRDVYPRQHVERVQAAATVPPEQVASAQEALVTLKAYTGSQADQPLRTWLRRECSGLLEQVEHGVRVEAARLSWYEAHDRYSGVLADEGLIALLADQLGPERPWSASQLNELGACRYRFFAKRLLGLEELWRPEPGLNALETGSLNHAILERTYADLAGRGLTIEEQNLGEALEALERSAREVFDAAERILNRPPDTLWPWEQQNLRARLEAFVRRDFSGESPVGKRLPGAGRRSLSQEYRFGFDDRHFTIPLSIDGRQEALRLRGYIDRMDVANGQALVIDYKSGSTAIPASHLAEGVEVQMLVYLRAAEHLLQADAEVSLAGGAFLQLRGLKSSGAVSLDERGRRDLQAAEQRIADNIAAARRGDFRVEPRLPATNGRCTRYCEFWQLCRVNETRSPGQEAAP
ncbi:MAG: PD-(D/E)XK nuclease family protein [Anaerolineaceae bacterium]|nr:PD-(D/E)XK nuclease family protein [Anaerolineaceae bacterium]